MKPVTPILCLLLLIVAGCASQRVHHNTGGQASPVASLTSDAGEELWIIAAAAAPDVSDRDEPRLTFRRLDVDVLVASDAALVDATQRYENAHDVPVPAAITYPLPERATLTGFYLTIGKRRIRGIIRPEDEARTLFDAARAQGLPAALIEAGLGGLLQQRLTAVPPRTRASLQLTYADPLVFENGAYTWTYRPPDAAKDAAARDTSLVVTVSNETPIESITTPSHHATIEVSPTDHEIRLAEAFAGRPFELRLRYPGGVAALPQHRTIALSRGGVAIDASPAQPPEETR